MRNRMNRITGSAPRMLMRTAGRWVLWGVVAIAAIRMVTGGFASSPAPVQAKLVTPAEWPDMPAQAVAARYARAFFRRDVVTAQRLTGSMETQVPVATSKARLEVLDAQPVATQRLGQDHGVVVVMVTAADGDRYLAVPVGRDRNGVAVSGQPYPAPPPAVTRRDEDQGDLLFGQERADLSTAVTQGVRAYLAGDNQALRFVSAPGARLRAAGGYELQTIDQLHLVSGTQDKKTVLARVTAVDNDKVSYTFGQRITLVRGRGMWLVEAFG